MIGKRWLSVVVLGMFLALASVCWSTPGDVDGFNGVELKDAVTALQVSAGLTVGDVTLEGDVNSDDAIGVAEAVFALREVAFSTPGDFENSLGMTFNLIPAGTFTMGSPDAEMGSYDWERPQHEVTLSQDFYIMTTEVTQAQWEAVMGSNPSYFDEGGGDCPVEQVSWNDVQDFIAALNDMDERTYRLPTEAEWEHAARAGTTTAFYNGDITQEGYDPIDPNLDAIGWYYGNSGSTTHPVGQKQPNAWGLYDMSGNVWEWVEDDWHSSYDGAPTDGSVWVDSPRASSRVLRGGGGSNLARYCRSANRGGISPSYRDRYDGFRLALSPGR